MSPSPALRAAALALPLVLAPACTIVAIDSQTGPPGVRADGLIEGHAVFGFRDEHQILNLELLGGSSPGAIGELILWRLARVEVGLAGLAIGLGPIDLALGCLFYDPRLPDLHCEHGDDRDGHEHENEHDDDDDDDDD